MIPATWLWICFKRARTPNVSKGHWSVCVATLQWLSCFELPKPLQPWSALLNLIYSSQRKTLPTNTVCAILNSAASKVHWRVAQRLGVLFVVCSWHRWLLSLFMFCIFCLCRTLPLITSYRSFKCGPSLGCSAWCAPACLLPSNRTLTRLSVTLSLLDWQLTLP